MTIKPYLSYSAATILHALKNGYQYGFDIMDVLGLPSGTVYPALRRLEEAELVESPWEEPRIAQRESRPARKYYALTRRGRERLAAAAERYRLPEPMLAPTTRPIRERG